MLKPMDDRGEMLLRVSQLITLSQVDRDGGLGRKTRRKKNKTNEDKKTEWEKNRRQTNGLLVVYLGVLWSFVNKPGEPTEKDT